MDEHILILDLDATIVSSDIYYRIVTKVMWMVEEAIAPYTMPPEELIEIYHTVENHNQSDATKRFCSEDYEEYTKANPNRFPIEMVHIYVEACFRNGLLPDKAIAEKVFLEGKRIFTEHYKFLPGVQAFLNHMAHKKGVKLYLITCGDPSLQKPKIEGRKIFLQFEKIFIIPMTQSKLGVIEAILKENPRVPHTRVYMVGDSALVDINPALAAGVNAVHVTGFNTHFNAGDVITMPSVRDRYFKFDTMVEVHAFFKKIFEKYTEEVEHVAEKVDEVSF
jgi:FMN phosphatase YigB (HAD superfamily)